MLSSNITAFVVYAFSLANNVSGNHYASAKQRVIFPLNFLMHGNLSVYGDVHVDFFSFKSALKPRIVIPVNFVHRSLS